MKSAFSSFAVSARSLVALPCAGLLLSVAPLFVSASNLAAQTPSLGSASNFAVLGAATVTNAGASFLAGDVGVAPGTAITGFPPGTATGTFHPGDPVAAQAQTDCMLAYNELTAATCSTTLTGQDLGGLTLTPGVYCFAAAAQLTGTLTLDAQGDTAAVFVFKSGSTFTTSAAAAVTLTNGARAGNVFWHVGSSAVLGAANNFSGNILALASITVGAASSVNGRLVALTAAVNLDTTAVLVPSLATNSNVGLGCGSPAPALSAIGMATLGNAAFALRTATAPNAPVFLFQSFGPANVALNPGCVLYLDSAITTTYGFHVLADGAGNTNIVVPVPNDTALQGVPSYWQAAELVVGGPLLGSFAISNGLMTVLGV